MVQKMTDGPFHAGERAAQLRAGVGDVSSWAGGFIRDHMPEQHRAFYSALPFLVVSASDLSGRTWVTLLDGADGFIRSPDPRSLTLDTRLDREDPLSEALDSGTDAGFLGIDLATRRRNRLSGYFRKSASGYVVDVQQTFGNCPQYIHERQWYRHTAKRTGPVRHADHLSADQIAFISNADTLFVGSGHMQGAETPSRGFDASHRGGAPGFVQVESPGTLRIPDYAGNNFFNTIGNLITDPRIGLVFVDFESGSLLHISGRATIDWDPQSPNDTDARRMIDVAIEVVIERPNALSLRWSRSDALAQTLKVTRRVDEAQGITSFFLRAADDKELLPFSAGQHLPVEVQLPGHSAPSRRSYSLSGSPHDSREYRLTIKREPHGLVSRYLHDDLQTGALIQASRPSGEFVIPSGAAPLVLVGAGVGLTPLVSMLHELAASNFQRRILFVQGARDGTHHAMRYEVDDLIDQLPNATRRLFYSRPDAGDVAGRDYDVQGRITAASLLELNPDPHAVFLLCGPVSFLSDIRMGLEAAGVPARNIQAEVFGAGS